MLKAPTVTPLAVSVADACRLIGIKRTLTFALLRDGVLIRVKVGRRTLVTMASIDRLLEEGSQTS